VVKRLVTEDGEAQTAADCLPFGTYSIREVMPGDGYFLTDGEPRTFSIERNGVIADPFAAKESFKNLVKRGDLDFVKVREGTMERLAGVPFRLISQTTSTCAQPVPERQRLRRAEQLRRHSRHLVRRRRDTGRQTRRPPL